MAFRPRDAHGRFLSRETWKLAYALAKQPVPTRVGKRNALAPLTVQEIDRLARKRTPVKVRGAKRTRADVKIPTVRPKEAAFPAGTEFELTARYKGRDKALLHIKIRVVLSAAMSDAQAARLLDQAVRTGRTPPGIEVATIDWARGKKSGDYQDPDADTVRAFYAPMLAGGVRFAKVASE